MRVIDKIALAIFSVLILIFSVIFILVSFNVIDADFTISIIKLAVEDEPNRTIFLVVAFICALLAIKIMFWDADTMENIKAPIEINNEGGILEISPNTIENISNIALTNYTQISDFTSRMKSEKKGISINISCCVLPETSITELTAEIQKNIKEKIEKQTSANVLEVNVKVKDLKKVKVIEEV